MSDTNIGLGGGPYATDGSSHITISQPASAENVQASRYEVPSEYAGGWLKQVAAEVTGTQGYLLLWHDDREGGFQMFSSPTQQSWGGGLTWRRYNLSASQSKAVRIEPGKSYWVGFWSNPASSRVFRINSQGQNPRGYKRATGAIPSFTGFGFSTSTLAADFFYQQNAYPGIGVVTYPSTNWMIVNTRQPTFSGTLPHDNGDANLDYSQMVNLVIRRYDTNETLLDQAFPVTQPEVDYGRFFKAPMVLPSSVPLMFIFRHQDSWGAWSQWSAWRYFSVAPGPLSPTLSAPIGRVNSTTGNVFSGTYTHETGLSSGAIQLTVWNAQGTQIIYDSGWVAKTVLHNQPWTFTPSLTLVNGQTYKWSARFRDTALIEGTYADSATLQVNAKPYPPTSMTPSGGRDTGEKVLSGSLLDPDGDQVTQVEVALTDLTTNTAVTGLNAPAIAGNTFTVDVSNKLTSGVYNHQFIWRARASDGFVFGDWSAWQSFTFKATPSGTYLLPLLGDVRNEVKVPSAEYDVESLGYWTETGRQRGANYLSANQSSAETDLTGITALYDTPVTRTTAEHYLGTASVRFDSSGLETDGHPRHGFYTDPSTTPLFAEATYAVASAYVKAPVGTTLTVAGRILDESGVFISETAGQQTYVATGAFQRIESLPFRHEEPNVDDPTIMDPLTFRAGVVVATPSGTGEVVYADALEVEPVFSVDDVATDFEIGSGGASSYIDRVEDSDAAFGSAAWEATNDGARTSHSYYSEFIDVDASKPRIFYAHLKKMTPDVDITTTFGVECYNASGTLLGTVYPSSISPSQDINALPYWRAVGGLVWQIGSGNSPAYPASTTKVRVRWWPNTSATTNPIVMRMDGVFASEMPASITSTDIVDAAKWYGYFDGDSMGFGDGSGVQYTWTGARGASASSGLNVVRDAGVFLYITYSHPAGLAKNADKLTIYRQDQDGTWVSVYAGDWTVSARTKIPIPTGILGSESRYKVVTELRDTGMLTSSMPNIVFDVRFEGPPELNILISRADPTTAQVHVTFDHTQLGITEFGGIEFAIGPRGSRVVVDRVQNPNVTEWVYPYPLASENSDYWVRQLENRAAELIPSRWDHTNIQADYVQWWLKDVEDPQGVALPVTVLAQDAPDIDETVTSTSYRPWGSEKQVHIISEARGESGALTLRLMDNDPLLQQRLDLIKEIVKRRKVMSLLMTRPVQKRFVQILDIKQTSAQVPYYAVYELSWADAAYSEDWYEREKQT